MLIELLSSANYVNFNIKLAQVFGLHTSIYISQLMDINEKALRKKKLDGDFFNIDRKYVQSRTTIEPTEQREIEKVLIKLGVLTKHKEKPDKVSLDISTLTSIMMSPDEDLIKDITDLAQPKSKKKTKAEVILENLQQSVITNQPELRQAYYDWIEAVSQKDGFMTKQAVISAQNNLDAFANHNLDIALKVLEIATIHGYRDITWAINNYKKDYTSNSSCGATITTPPISVSSARTAPITLKRATMSDEVF